MLLHNTITGVIAAVMVALGAGQIGNTSTQVGEELVVENNVLLEEWFVYDVSPGYPQNLIDATNASNYRLVGSEPTELCDGSDEICAIKAMPSSSAPNSPPDITGATLGALQTYFDSGHADSEYIKEQDLN